MKKILITGVSGFIGTSLYNFLSARNKVFGISRSNSAGFEHWESIDFLDKHAVNSFIKSNKFDVIINLAAVLTNPSNAGDIGVFYENIAIQTNLVEALKDYGICHFVNFSSSAVYPNISGMYKETDEIDPSPNNDSLYGLAKFNSEILFKSLLPKTIQQLHLRVGFVHGKGMNPSRMHQVFKKELLETNNITLFGNGIRTIPQIEILSLCKKLQYLIDNDVIGVLNVADENISLETLAKRTIAEYGNSESSIIYKPQGNMNEFKLNVDKMNNLFL